MIDPIEYVVSEDDVISDVDLDTEVVRLQDGRRLTNELGEQLAEETLIDARRRNPIPGRKSLSGGSVHSPRVLFRAREALAHYLAS